MMVPCWWRQMHAQSAMVQSQAEPSWQEGSDIQFLRMRIVRFSELNKRESYPTQDEPEGRACFQYKMSLRDKAC